LVSDTAVPSRLTRTSRPVVLLTVIRVAPAVIVTVVESSAPVTLPGTGTTSLAAWSAAFLIRHVHAPTSRPIASVAVRLRASALDHVVGRSNDRDPLPPGAMSGPVNMGARFDFRGKNEVLTYVGAIFDNFSQVEIVDREMSVTEDGRTAARDVRDPCAPQTTPAGVSDSGTPPRPDR
jgi:hypothetical protein